MRLNPVAPNHTLHVKSEMSGELDADMRTGAYFRMLAMVDVAAGVKRASAKYNRKMNSLDINKEKGCCAMLFLYPHGISDTYVKLMRGLQFLDPVAADDLLALARTISPQEMWVRSSINAHTPLEAAVAASFSSEFGSSETAEHVLEILVSRGAPLVHVVDDMLAGGPSSGPLHMLMARAEFDKVRRLLEVATAAGRFQGCDNEPTVEALLGFSAEMAPYGNLPAEAAIHAGHAMKLLQSDLVRNYCSNTAKFRAKLAQRFFRAAAMSIVAKDVDDFAALFAVLDELDANSCYAGRPLHRACEGGATNAIPAKHGSTLVEKLTTVQILATDLGRRTALHAAVCAGNVAMVAALLERDASLANVAACRTSLETSERVLKAIIRRRHNNPGEERTFNGTNLAESRSPVFTLRPRGKWPLQMALEHRGKDSNSNNNSNKSLVQQMATLIVEALARLEGHGMDYDAATDCIVFAVERHMDSDFIARLVALWKRSFDNEDGAISKKEESERRQETVPRRAIRAAVISNNRSFLYTFCSRDRCIDTVLNEQSTYRVGARDDSTEQGGSARGSGASAVRAVVSTNDKEETARGKLVTEGSPSHGITTPLLLALDLRMFDMADYLIQELGASTDGAFLADLRAAGKIAIPDARGLCGNATLDELRLVCSPFYISRLLRGHVATSQDGQGAFQEHSYFLACSMLDKLLQSAAGSKLSQLTLSHKCFLLEQFLRSRFVGDNAGTERLATFVKALGMHNQHFLQDHSAAANESARPKDYINVKIDEGLWRRLLATGSFTGYDSIPRAALETALLAIGRSSGFRDESGEEEDEANGSRAIVSGDGGDEVEHDPFGERSDLARLLYHDCVQLRCEPAENRAEKTDLLRSPSAASLRARLSALWATSASLGKLAADVRSAILNIMSQQTWAIVAAAASRNEEAVVADPTQLPLWQFLTNSLINNPGTLVPVSPWCVSLVPDAKTAVLFIDALGDSICRMVAAVDASMKRKGYPWIGLSRFAYSDEVRTAISNRLIPKLAGGDAEIETQLRICFAHAVMARSSFTDPLTGTTHTYAAAQAALFDDMDNEPATRRRLCALNQRQNLDLYFAPAVQDPTVQGGFGLLEHFLLSEADENHWMQPLACADPETRSQRIGNHCNRETVGYRFRFSDFLDVIQRCPSTDDPSSSSSSYLIDDLLPRAFLCLLQNNPRLAADAISKARFWQRMLAVCISCAQSSHARHQSSSSSPPRFFSFLLSPSVMEESSIFADNGAYRAMMFQCVVMAVLCSGVSCGGVEDVLAHAKKKYVDTASSEERDKASHSRIWAAIMFAEPSVDAPWDIAKASPLSSEGDECDDGSNEPPPCPENPTTRTLMYSQLNQQENNNSISSMKSLALWRFIGKGMSFERAFANIGFEKVRAANFSSELSSKVQQPGGEVNVAEILNNYNDLSPDVLARMFEALTAGGLSIEQGSDHQFVSSTNGGGDTFAERAVAIDSAGRQRSDKLSFAIIEYATKSLGSLEAVLQVAPDDWLTSTLRNACALGIQAAIRFVAEHHSVLRESSSSSLKFFDEKGPVMLHESVFLYDPESKRWPEGVFTHRFAATSSSTEEEGDAENNDSIAVVKNVFSAAAYAARMAELHAGGSSSSSSNKSRAILFDAPASGAAAASSSASSSATLQRLSPTELESLLSERLGAINAAPSLCSSEQLQDPLLALQLNLQNWQLAVFGWADREDVVQYGGFSEDQVDDVLAGRARAEYAGGASRQPGCYADVDYSEEERAFVIKVRELKAGGDTGGFLAYSPRLQRLYDRIMAPKLFNQM